MSVADAYATKTQYIARFGEAPDGVDTEIDMDLMAVSRFIDQKLGRFFTQDTSVVARRYNPTVENQRTLFVDDIATTTGLIVKVDDNRDGTAEVSLTLTTDYEVRPLNAPFGPEPGPYTSLYLPPRSKRSYWWELVEVTAQFGWPNVPKSIADATIQLTGILRLESPRATTRIPEGIDAAITVSPTGQRLVDELLCEYAKPIWVYS